MKPPSPPPEKNRWREATPFSYACHRCLRCCHDKLIQVNPYEAARLARGLGISTTQLIADHLEEQRYLRRRDNGACVFLGYNGCTVHADRPLVCRLYPLGRRVVDGQDEGYTLLEPHPDSAGVYGSTGTVGDYVGSQGAVAFIAEADEYLALLRGLFNAWWDAIPDGDAATAAPSPSTTAEIESSPPDLQDVDAALARYCATHDLAEPTEIEARTELHRRIITEWLHRERASSA